MDNKYIENSIFELMEVAQCLVNKGWVERNSGNFSLRVDEVEMEMFPVKKELPSSCPTHEACGVGGGRGGALWRMTNENKITFLITHTGSKFRDIAKSALVNLGVLKYDDGILLHHATKEGASPSSEFISHLLIHDFLAKNKPEKKIILHVHPTHLIALSHKYEGHSKNDINILLQNKLPEVKMIIPQGIGLVPLLPPGSIDLAEATINELAEHDIVLWAKHGCLVVAEDIWEAYDMVDILDKAAEIQWIMDNG